MTTKSRMQRLPLTTATRKLIACAVFAGLVLALAPTAGADTFTWADPTTGGEWTDPANWTETTGDGYPNGVGDIANFYPSAGSAITITIAGDVTVGEIRNAANKGIRLEGDGKIIWDNDGNGATYNFDGTINSSGNGIWVDMELADDLELIQNSWNRLTYGGTITESGGSRSIIYDFVWQMYQGRWVQGSSPNTYGGGTILRGGRNDRTYAFTLDKDGAIGTGDLTLDITPGDIPDLRITDNGDTDDRIDDSASLYLEYFENDRHEYTTVLLDANVDETIGALYFDLNDGAGPVQQPAGTYGAVGTGADYQDDDWFQGTGILTVLGGTSSDLYWDGGEGSWFATDKWDGGPVAANSNMIIDAENDGAEPPAISGPSVVTADADYVTGGDGPAKSVTLGAIGDSTNDAQLKVDVGVTLEVTGATTVEEFGKLISQVQGNDTDVTAEAGVVETDELAIHGADSIQVDWTPGSDATSMFGGVYTISEYAGTALADFGESANAAGNIGGAYIKNTDYAVDVNGDGSLYAVEIELHGQGVGDTDLDGVVGPADLADFGLGWSPNGTDKTWFEGDFDFNGNVDPADLAAFGLAWAPNGIAFPSDSGMGVVPEPGTALMLLLAAAGLLIYRKRR